MDCYMLLRTDGTIITTNADTTYSIIADSEKKAKLQLLFERWVDNITGFCTDMSNVIVQRVSITDVNWEFESQHIEEVKKYAISTKEFIRRASIDARVELDIQKTILKSESKKFIIKTLLAFHNVFIATKVLILDLTTVSE